MKIGIDYHGVINRDPKFFAAFTKEAVKKRVEIFVVSGGARKDVEAYLKEHDISYNGIFSLLDYFSERNMVTFYEDGSFFVENEIWNRAKAKFCFDNKIDVHIDDSMLYGAYFQTPFCLYSPQGQNCTMIKKNISIDFSKTPDAVLEDLIEEVSNLVQNK